jgi:cell shape-determining protein MreC
VVSEVSRPPHELFKKVQVEPYASFKYNEMVFVVGAGGPATVPAGDLEPAATEGTTPP